MTVDQEYQSLREEMNESKRYVFERPLLTIMALIALAQFTDKEYLIILPFLSISFLIFNLWFTVNRLRSASRIAAYIQVVHENTDQDNWIGWETFLRYQRIWLKKTPKKEIEEKLEKIPAEAIPDALFYYPAIFNFHLVIVTIALLISTYCAIKSSAIHNSMAFAATIIISIYFFKYTYGVRPKRMRTLIEKNRVICEAVLEDVWGNNINVHPNNKNKRGNPRDVKCCTK